MNRRYAAAFSFMLLLTAAPDAATQSPAAKGATVQAAGERLAAIFDRDKAKPQALLLGVFHFAGEQVDANTTPANLRVDMLSPDRQRQINDLVRRLAAFNPTKIAIEDVPGGQAAIDSQYRDYREGRLVATGRLNLADERVQLAFRLAAQLKLDRLYPVDAQSFRFALSARDSVLTFEKYKDQPVPASEYWNARYDALSAYQDTLKATMPLVPFLAHLNSPEAQARSIGRWLVTTKRGSNDEPIGADGFITRYYNRNVRIYSNIQRMVTSPDDRILVIYGATHMYMLRHLFAASPEFVLEDIQPYLR